MDDLGVGAGLVETECGFFFAVDAVAGDDDRFWIHLIVFKGFFVGGGELFDCEVEDFLALFAGDFEGLVVGDLADLGYWLVLE